VKIHGLILVELLEILSLDDDGALPDDDAALLASDDGALLASAEADDHIGVHARGVVVVGSLLLCSTPQNSECVLFVR